MAGRNRGAHRVRALTAASCAIAFGASFSAAPAFANKANDTLVAAFQQGINNADLYFNTNRDGAALAHNIWDQLVEHDPTTFKLAPGLATSWKWVDDLTLEFHLREGVTFQNGQPFTADDVVYTLNFVANPANKVLDQTNVDWIKSAEKVNEYTVLVHLKAPFPAALQYFANVLPIYPHVYYAKVGPDGMGSHPIGSGPYEVRELVPGKSITLLKYPGYWHGSPRGEAHIGKVIFTFPPQRTTQIAGLMAGQIDWMWQVPVDQVKDLARVKSITVTPAETMRVRYLDFDAAGRSGKSPIQNVKVRQAIAYAIDRPEFAKIFFGEKAEVPKAPCFRTQFGCYQGAMAYPYDPAKAKELMREAGYAHGFHTTLYATRNPTWAVALAGYMKAIGINVTIQALQYPTIHRLALEGKTPLLSEDWNSYAINDASAFLGNFFTGTKDDFSGDKELNTWVEQADVDPNSKTRLALYKKAIERIMDRMYMLPLATFQIYYAYSSDLNFVPYVDEIPRFYLASWK